MLMAEFTNENKLDVIDTSNIKFSFFFIQQVLMAEFTNENKYRQQVSRFLDNANNLPKTPMGMTWKQEWGPNRYAG